MLSVLLAVLMQVVAPRPPGEGSIIVDPQWIQRPNGEDINRYYPMQAARRELQGRAVLACAVTAEGTLTGCKVVEESPTDVGFGDAALKLSTRYRMRSTLPDGRSVAGGAIRIPLRFSLPGQMDPLSAMYSCYGVTAVAAEANPSDQLAGRAFGFFAAQAAILISKGYGTPTAFEKGLAEARRSAAPATNAPPAGPSLKACLDVASANLK